MNTSVGPALCRYVWYRLTTTLAAQVTTGPALVGWGANLSYRSLTNWMRQVCFINLRSQLFFLSHL